MSAETIDAPLRFAAIWEDYCNGYGDIGALAEHHGLSYSEAAGILEGFSSRHEREREATPDPGRKYLAGLHWDLREAIKLLGKLEGESPKLTCLKQITTLREKIAAAEGVAIVLDPETVQAQFRIIGIPLHGKDDPLGDHLELGD